MVGIEKSPSDIVFKNFNNTLLSLGHPMKHQLRALTVSISLCIIGNAHAQPGTAKLTAGFSFPSQQVKVEVPSKFNGLFNANRQLTIPIGYKIRVFHTGGLSKPRFMSFDPKGVLHVADQTAGKVFALPDKNGDGVADTMFEVAGGFSISHDVKFYKGAMYVTNERQVFKLIDNNGDGIYETRTVFIDNIAEGATQPGGGHRTRTLAFDSVNAKAYLSIGSYCNVCREEFRAIIERYNDDGSGRETFANGVRNAVGMDIQLGTKKLWANNNGSDNQGNEVPPEWFDVVRKGGFYGYPFAYGNQVYFNMNANSTYRALLPITAQDSAMVRKMVQPGALIRAHTAPMAIQFLNSSFPSDMQYGMLSALRGSWNAPGSHRGFSVIYLHLKSPTDTVVSYVANFVTGFLTDSVNRVYWGRPVGLAINNQGSVFISSDEGSTFILQLYRDDQAGLKKIEASSGLKLFPNPVKNVLHVEAAQPIKQLRVVDARGRFCGTFGSPTIDTQRWPAGVYAVKAELADGSAQQATFVKCE